MSDWTSGVLPAVLSAEAVSALRSVLKAVRATQDAAAARDAFFSLSVNATAPTIPALPSIGDVPLDASIHMLVVPVVGADALNVSNLVSPLTVASQLGYDPDAMVTALSPSTVRGDDGVRRLADTISRSLVDTGDLCRPLYDAHGGMTCLALVAVADDPADFCAAAAALEFAANPTHSVMGALAPPPRDIVIRPGANGLVQLTATAPQPAMLSTLQPARTALLLAEDAACLRARRVEDLFASPPSVGTFKTQMGKVACQIVDGILGPFKREAWQYAATAREYVSRGKSCWSALSDWTKFPVARATAAASGFPDWVMLKNPLALRADLEKLGQWGGDLGGRTSANDILKKARAKRASANDRAEAALQLLSASGGGVYATSFSGTGGTAYLLSELTKRLLASDGPGANPVRYAAGVFVVFGAPGVGSVPGSFEFNASAGEVDPLLSAPPVLVAPTFRDDLSSVPAPTAAAVAVPLATAATGTTTVTPRTTLGSDLTTVPSADDRNPNVSVTGREPVKC